MTVKWYGDDLLKQIRDATPDALFEAGETYIKAAASRAPRDEGDLRDSGYVKSEKKSTYKRKKNHNREVVVSKDAVAAGFAVFYAHMVEFGTVKKAARPFIRPTIDETKAQLGDIAARAIAGQLKFIKARRSKK